LTEPVVVDSTCLIGLEKIGHLDLLSNLFGPVCAPPEVERESGLSPEWLKIEKPSNPALVAALKVTVDDGEAEAIALAAERKWRIVLDDRRARDVAQRMELKVIGTVGILIRAKRAGLLPWIKPLLNELTEKGFRLSEDLKREALRMAGE
jgi:predicted nucleic acid-binding protein